MRLIDADALYTAITDRFDYCEDILEVVEAQLTVEPDWIPCRKPPTKNDAYLVTVHPDYVVPGGGQVDILVWVDDDWFFVDYGGKIARFPDPVIAWRLLPAPYKEAPNGSD